MEERVLEGADDGAEMARIFSKSERVADQRPEHGDDAHHGESLHHGAEDVFAPDKAAVEEGETGAAHHEDKGAGDEHPGVVAGGLRAGNGGLEVGVLLFKREQALFLCIAGCRRAGDAVRLHAGASSLCVQYGCERQQGAEKKKKCRAEPERAKEAIAHVQN